MTTKAKHTGARSAGVAFDAVLQEDLRRPDFADAFARRRLAHEIARVVRAMREQAGLSQAQLAALIGAKQPTVARLETSAVHTPQWKLLDRIGAALGKQLRLVYDDPDQDRPIVECKGRKTHAVHESPRSTRAGGGYNR